MSMLAGNRAVAEMLATRLGDVVHAPAAVPGGRQVTVQRNGLTEWVRHAFEAKDTIAAKNQSDLEKFFYAYYSSHGGGQAMDPSGYKEFLDQLGDVEKASKGCNFTVYPQVFSLESKKGNNPFKVMETLLAKYDANKKAMDEAFAYFVDAGPQLGKETRGATGSRITLRLVPSHATTVFKHVATELVGSTEFPDVTKAKIMGPAKIGVSTDSIVIYIKSAEPEVVNQIVDHLSEYLGQDMVREGAPPTMEDRGKGISYAECASGGQSSSHGKSRSVPMAKGFKAWVNEGQPDGFDGLLERIKAALRDAKIDPDNPWKNLA